MFMALITMIKFSGQANNLVRNGWMLYAGGCLSELKLVSRLALPPITGRDSCKLVGIM
jgi:hypothetical protein